MSSGSFYIAPVSVRSNQSGVDTSSYEYNCCSTSSESEIFYSYTYVHVRTLYSVETLWDSKVVLVRIIQFNTFYNK